MLENFSTQKSLSHQQAHWLEELSQFDMKICYIKGEDNTVADALSRLPPDDLENVPDCDDIEICNWQAWLLRGTSAAVNHISIHADANLLKSIRDGYLTDEFCKKFCTGHRILPSVHEENGLWFLGSCLLIPHCGNVQEDLFHLAHDVFDHSGPDKAYEVLRDSFYWPNMRRDLQHYYIPGCEAYARNKSSTTKPSGPAHPLPVPDGRGTSVALDFVGPLPEENRFNCLLSMTCRLGLDIRLVPCHTNISAEEAAALFFDHWYCENGLPLEIIADRDKLWTSTFWKTLQRLSGVRLALSSSFHPETDGLSEQSNKTLVQSICFYVDRVQHGWVQILPCIQFAIMNTTNVMIFLFSYCSSSYASHSIRLIHLPCPHLLLTPYASSIIGLVHLPRPHLLFLLYQYYSYPDRLGKH
ncbi:reverse transcriptase-rnase h-integrase [Moniliophthora roreri MCA 2997]|uniref:Reverse transcriptase-rnase h-integrase n=1 Tax=Moniliophthora roreri (strain MCA 2997) TaxID=1381753 RepID=V2W1I9_MONRO|nr:reverse transcriptase-rnase h-integrase [Moniliophthora roreri MCA 2997]